MKKIIDQVNGPADLKNLSLPEMEELASEIRELLLEKVSQTGGHVGPNLGVVELTIALHRVFDSPRDKFVWDVSHQSYPHKILTGRKNAWLDPKHFHDVSGYTAPDESEHDFFTVGHASTSISLVTGMAKARDLLGNKENLIAIIGDGSLSGGLAFEGLDNAATFNSNLIIIVNDNDMSIAENHGGIYQNLRKLRETNGQYDNNLFKAIGLDYRYLAQGNDLEALINLFTEVKDIDHPIVLHIYTEKGHGYSPAIENKMGFHWRVPFDLKTGNPKGHPPQESYDKIILNVLDEKITAGMPIVAINAAIPNAFNLKTFEADHPDRYIDVGIAEEDSITMAAGMAKLNSKPVVFHNSTFLQRAYDQLSHDLGINSLPAVVIVKNGTISPGDPTHQGSFDIPMISSIPNLIYLAPTSAEELTKMLNWALEQNEKPVLIRIPAHGVTHYDDQESRFNPFQYHYRKHGSKVAIIAVGSFMKQAELVWQKLQEEHGINASLVDPRSVTEFDVDFLNNLKNDHNVIVTLEDGSLEGGFGEKIARFYDTSPMKVLNFGSLRRFNHRETLAELYQEAHLTPEQIVADLLEIM